jgi:hypothetical protein
VPERGRGRCRQTVTTRGSRGNGVLPALGGPEMLKSALRAGAAQASSGRRAVPSPFSYTIVGEIRPARESRGILHKGGQIANVMVPLVQFEFVRHGSRELRHRRWTILVIPPEYEGG